MDNSTQLVEGQPLIGKWDYEAREVIMSNGDPELSFKKGQQMKLVKVLSSDWLRVEMVIDSNSLLGVVPKSYVALPRNSLEKSSSNDDVIPESNDNLLEGKFDYTSNGIVMSNGDKDLSFHKYDRMILLEKCPNHWIKVKLVATGEVGVVPANYARPANSSERRKTMKSKFATISSCDTDYATFINIANEMSRPVPRVEMIARDRSYSEIPTSQASPKFPVRKALSEDSTSAPPSLGGTPTSSPPATPEDSPQVPRSKAKMIKVLGVSEENIHMLVPATEPPKLEKQRSSSKLKKLLGVQGADTGSSKQVSEYQFPQSYSFRHSDNYECIIFALETSDNGIPLIRAATLEKLIEKLTHHESVDPDFVYEFLLTFRCFTTTQQVLKLLKERYHTPTPVNLTDSNDIDKFQTSFLKPIRLRISNVFKKWIEDHWYDFAGDPSLLNNVKAFLNEMKQSGMEASASTLSKLIQNKQEGKRKEAETSTKSRPDPIEPDMKVLTSLESQLQILAFHPLEIARQLTLIEFETFTKIQPRECIGQHWSKKERQHKAENVVGLIQRFNKVSQWVTSAIVQIDNVKSRADVLIKFIEVAEHFNKLNNISGMMQMAAGLRHSSIHRLKRTWAAVPSKKLKAWDDIVQLLDPYSNYSTLRSRMKTVAPPLLPYLGMFLTDFTFIEDGNPDDLSGLINFDKWRRLATSVKELIHFQQTPYNFVPLPIMQAFLLAGGEYVDESSVYQMSLKIEPRGQSKVKVNALNWRKSTNVQKKEMISQRAQSMQQFYAISKKKEEEQVQKDEPKDESQKHRNSFDSQGSNDSETPSPTSSFLSMASEQQLEEYLQTLSISDSEKQQMREQYSSSDSRTSSRRSSVDELEDPPLDELVELLISEQTQKFEEYFEGINPDQAESIRAQVNRLYHAVLSSQQK